MTRNCLVLLVAFVLLEIPAAFLSASERERGHFRSREAFERKIVESYRIMPGIEPEVSSLELTLLEKVEELLSRNPAHAQIMLEDIVLGDKPSNALFNHTLGTVYVEMGQLDKAETQYLAAVRKHPSFLRAWNALGILRFQQDRFEEALSALSRSIELGLNGSDTYGMIGYCNFQLNNFSAAVTAYNLAIMRDPGNPDWLEGKAMTLMQMDQPGQALALFDELISKNPADSDLWLAQANSWISHGDREKAVRNIEIARSLGTIPPDALFLLGNLYLELKMSGHAAERYLEAIKHPDAADAPRKIIGGIRLLIRHGDYEEARALFNEMDPPADDWLLSERIRYSLISAELARRENNLDAAIEELRWASERDPFHAEVLYKLGQYLIDDGRIARAMATLERIPEDSSYYYNSLILRVRQHLRDNQQEKALPLAEEALKIRPGRELRSLINQIRQSLRQEREIDMP